MFSFNNQTSGIAWFLVHCFCFSLASIISKLLVDNIPIFQIIFCQTLVATCILLPPTLAKCRKELKVYSYKIHIIRSFFWVAATAIFYYSITIIPVTKAFAIVFALPLFTTILAVIFLKEKLHVNRIMGLIFGFIGMLVIIQPGLSRFEIASILVILSAFFWALTDIIIKVTSQAHPALVNSFYFCLFGCLIISPMALYSWKTPSNTDILWLLLMGAIFAGNIIAVNHAYKKADLTTIMPFSFSQLIFSALFAYIIFGQMLNIYTVIGSIIIISSTSYIAYREKKRHGHYLAPDIGEELYDLEGDKPPSKAKKG